MGGGCVAIVGNRGFNYGGSVCDMHWAVGRLSTVASGARLFSLVAGKASRLVSNSGRCVGTFCVPLLVVVLLGCGSENGPSERAELAPVGSIPRTVGTNEERQPGEQSGGEASPHGKWLVVESWNSGERASDLLGCELTIPLESSRLVFNSPSYGTYHFRYELDEDKLHFQFTVFFNTLYGIYRIDNDTMLLCLGNERPSDFVSTNDSQTRLLTLKRADSSPAEDD